LPIGMPLSSPVRTFFSFNLSFRLAASGFFSVHVHFCHVFVLNSAALKYKERNIVFWTNKKAQKLNVK